jgi:hypothetical protein
VKEALRGALLGTATMAREELCGSTGEDFIFHMAHRIPATRRGRFPSPSRLT